MERGFQIKKWLMGGISLLLTGCSLVSVSAPGERVYSDRTRQDGSQVSAPNRQLFSQGNRAFALDLYHRLGQEDRNLFFSPYSISIAMAMTYAGARGDTEKQMGQVLHFLLPREELHQAANSIDQELASRKDFDSETQDTGGKGFQLNIVNDIWSQKGYPFLQEYLDVLALNYGAGIQLMDFRTKPDQSRQQINRYIAEKTEQKIKDLIAPGQINQDTRLVLTNAIYFNAAWKYPFEKESTRDQDFTLLDGSVVKVPMMALFSGEHLRYLDGDGVKCVALPYQNQDLAMIILMPDQGKFPEFQSSLHAGELERMLAEMQFATLKVKMPRFEVESSSLLSEQLKAMGMPGAFNDADFSGMTGKRDLVISEVVHKAFVKVDEEGTEAAAATAVIVMETMALIDEPIELDIDRPFIFMIYDYPTSSILFMGTIINPVNE